MDEFFALGGVVYEKTADERKPNKVCIIFEDEHGRNRKLLLEALNTHRQKGQGNGS